MNHVIAEHRNLDLSLGVNQRLHGRLLSDQEATQLLNVDISVPGYRRKRQSPTTRVTLDDTATTPVTGMCPYILSGVPYIVATVKGKLYQWDGTATPPTGQTGATISNTERVFMQQCRNGSSDVIYGTDQTNHPFKWDGTTWSQPTINDSSGTRLTAVNDLLWFKSRLWVAVNDTIHWSEVIAPESFLIPSIRVRSGAGDKILKMMPYRDDYIIVFKGGSDGIGSVHLVNTVAFEITPLFHDIPIVAAGAIVRAGLNDQSDVFFFTREGLRSLRMTDDGSISGPTLPISYHIKDETDNLSWAKVKNVHACVFDDELILWTPVAPNDYPTRSSIYTMRPPKQTPQNGWVVCDMMAAFSTAVVGFSNNRPRLYIGSNTGGVIQEAFSDSADDAVYEEISKRITFDDPYVDKTPRKIVLTLDSTSSGELTVSLLDDSSNEYVIGTFEMSGGVLEIDFDVDAELLEPGVADIPIDCRYDVDANAVHRSKSWRVKLRSLGNPVLLGYTFKCHAEKPRYIEYDDSTTYTFGAEALGDEEVGTDADIAASAIGD